MFTPFYEDFKQLDPSIRMATYIGACGLVLFMLVSALGSFESDLFEGLFDHPSAEATASLGYEAESGSLAGNVQIVTDSGTSGGKAIQFGALPTNSSSQFDPPTITGKTFYLDCSDGNDSLAGSSPSAAWKSLGKASSASLAAGDGLLLKRGSKCNGTLAASWNGTASSNVIVAAYGSGAMPVIENGSNGSTSIDVKGSYITFSDIETRALASSFEAGCGNNPKGHITGFEFESGATYSTVMNSKSSGGYAGIYIKSGAHHNRILGNDLSGNTMMSPLDTTSNNDAGAFGVLLWGDDNEIAYNSINNNDACSYDYGRDGSAVEVYNGSRNRVHHNTALNDDAFTELGKDSSHTSDGNIYAYNLFVSTNASSIFLNTRGSGTYGPITNTKAYNNTAYLTGSSSQGVVCSGCASNILTLKNNIIWANWKTIYASAPFNESNNIYWRSGGSPLIQGFTIASTSLKADPRFVLPGTDFHLQSGSPAINAGSSESVTSGYTKDLGNTTVPNGSAPEIGAYEY